MTDVERLGVETSAPFMNLAELGDILAESKAARRCFVTQVFRFAHGRLEDTGDTCTIDDLDQTLRDSGDLRELLIAVVTHPSFRRRAAEAP